MNTLSKKGAQFITLHEGWRSRYYLDPVGVPTIGYGFTWRSRAFREWWAKHKNTPFDKRATLTKQEGLSALFYLIREEYGKAVNNFLGKKVPQHVYDAMVSAVYNLGPGSLKWTWARYAKEGDYEEAYRRLRKTGTTAGGKRLPGLVRRRSEEALLLLKGVYTGVKDVPSIPAPKPDPVEPPKPEKKTLIDYIVEFILNLFKGDKI